MQIPEMRPRKRSASDADISPEVEENKAPRADATSDATDVSDGNTENEVRETDASSETVDDGAENTPSHGILTFHSVPTQNPPPSQRAPGLSSLPVELLDAIFSHLTVLEIARCRELCRSLNISIIENRSTFAQHIVTREQRRLSAAVRHLDGLRYMDFLDAVVRFDRYCGAYRDFVGVEERREGLDGEKEVESRLRGVGRMFVRPTDDNSIAAVSSPPISRSVTSTDAFVSVLLALFRVQYLEEQRSDRPSSAVLDDFMAEIRRDEATVQAFREAFSWTSTPTTGGMSDEMVATIMHRIRQERPFGRESTRGDTTAWRVPLYSSTSHIYRVPEGGICRRCRHDFEVPDELRRPGYRQYVALLGHERWRELVRRHNRSMSRNRICDPFGHRCLMEQAFRTARMVEDMFVWF